MVLGAQVVNPIWLFLLATPVFIGFRLFRRRSGPIWWMVFCTFILCGQLMIAERISIQTDHVLLKNASINVSLAGKVEKVYQQAVRLHIRKINNYRVKWVVFASLGGTSLYPGDRVNLQVHLPDRNILKESRSSSASPVFLKKAELVAVKPSRFRWLHQKRDQFTVFLTEQFSEEHAICLTGLLIGLNGVKLGPEMETMFRDLGLLHAIVVSGAQVALISRVVLIFLGFIFRSSWLKFLGVSVVNLLFIALVGSDVSVVRAVLMLEIGLFLSFDFRQKRSLDILAVSGIILLLFAPDRLFSLGFQLSFLATLAILEVSPRISLWLEEHLSLSQTWAELVSVSTGPLLLTAPWLMFQFHRFDSLALVSNIFFGNLIEWIVLGGFAGLVGWLIHPLFGQLICWPVFGLYYVFLTMARWLMKIPHHTLWFDVASPMVIGLLYLNIGITWLSDRQLRARHYIRVGLLCSLVFTVIWVSKGRSSIEVFIDRSLDSKVVVVRTHSQNLVFLEEQMSEFEFRRHMTTMGVYREPKVFIREKQGWVVHNADQKLKYMTIAAPHEKIGISNNTDNLEIMIFRQAAQLDPLAIRILNDQVPLNSLFRGGIVLGQTRLQFQDQVHNLPLGISRFQVSAHHKKSGLVTGQ